MINEYGAVGGVGTVVEGIFFISTQGIIII
jgi:hypothetical protein